MPSIHPTASVADSAELAPDVDIGPYCTVGGDVQLGAGVRLVSHVAIAGDTHVGEGSVVYPFASLGSPPQHLGYKGEPTKLRIGARTLIREHVTLNLGTAQGRGVTQIGDDCMFMIGSHVAHDCVVGNKVIFANNATLGGHVTVGDGVFLGGLCAVHQNARIGRFAFVGGMAGLEGDLIPYGSVMGNRAYLAGLNIVGMKRRQMTREQIHGIRRGFRTIFHGPGTLGERLEAAEREFAGNAEVGEIIAFLRADAKRPLCVPPLKHGAPDSD